MPSDCRANSPILLAPAGSHGESLGSRSSGLSSPEQASSRWDAESFPSPVFPRSTQGAMLRPPGNSGLSHQQVPCSRLHPAPSCAAHVGTHLASPRRPVMLSRHSGVSARVSALLPSWSETFGGWGPRSRGCPHCSAFSSLPHWPGPPADYSASASLGHPRSGPACDSFLPPPCAAGILSIPPPGGLHDHTAPSLTTAAWPWGLAYLLCAIRLLICDTCARLRPASWGC